ncbi:hypothetical protein [uncultured Sutterella sp.]|uniref:hypothetical protein n=1 Tax=uncultured Sutterella sp. TaxID=286133 RepID=UPI00266F81BF|nr:hypothetical protein [uncultured Sutterella sp.]
MQSKKATTPAGTGSKTAASAASPAPEGPVTPAPAPAAPSPAKKRAGKGAKAAPKKDASKPSKQTKAEDALSAATAAPEAASAYPFPPPPEALPWEGVGDALPRRKDQLEINRREREKLAELLGSAEGNSPLTAQAREAHEEKAEAAPAPEGPVFLGQSQKKNAPSAAKAEKPATAVSPAVTETEKSSPESNASAPSKAAGTPKKPKTQKPAQKADPAKAKKAAKPKNGAKNVKPAAAVAAAPQTMACFRNAEKAAPSTGTAPVEPAPAAAPGNDSVKDAPAQNAPDAEEKPASPEPTRFSSGRSGVFGASLGRGLQELSEELPGESSYEASGEASEEAASTFVDAPAEREASTSAPDADPDAPHFIALDGRRKNLESREKPHEPMRELFPSGTHEIMKEMADPDWKEKFLADSLALRDELAEEEKTLAIRAAADALPLPSAEELARARIECEAIKGERPRLSLADHPDILLAFPDDPKDAYLAVLMRETARLESKAREIAELNPADPRLPQVLSAFEEALEAALPAFEEKVRGINARVRLLKEAGAAAFLRGPMASDAFHPEDEDESRLSSLMDALARISRGELPKSSKKREPTPTSLWLDALEGASQPHAEAAAPEKVQRIPGRNVSRVYVDASGAQADHARPTQITSSPDGSEPTAASSHSQAKSFLFRPASSLGAIASALLCAAIVPFLVSTVFPSPVFAVVDHDFVRERVALLRIAHTRPGMPEREDLRKLDGDRIDEAIRSASESKGLPVLDAKAVLAGAAYSRNTRDLTDEVFERLGIRPEELRVLDDAIKEGWAADLSNLAESRTATPSALMAKAREAEANPPSPHSDHDFMDRVKRTLRFLRSDSTQASKGEAP